LFMLSWLKNVVRHSLASKQNKRRSASGVFYTSLDKVYVPVSQLAIGMYVAELDRPWLETSFAFQGFELKNEADVQAIRDVCDYVYIDMTKHKKGNFRLTNNKQTATNDLPGFGSPPQKLSLFEKEIERASEVYHFTEAVVADMMEKIARSGCIDSKLAREAVAACVNSVLHSPDAMLWMTQLKNRDEYTAQHSLNVCVLSIVLGRHLNLPETSLHNVGLCGMMHDMGKMLVPLEILNKPGRLEQEEMHIMQSHTTLGYELLKSSHGMYTGAADVALTHHERIDGTGYPGRVGYEGLSYLTKIVSIVDIYDAITSDRVYQKGRTHLEATNILSNISGTQLDPLLVIKFIESLGVYPPGCVVEMTNGSIAIVVEVNEKIKLRPKIIVLLDEEKNPVAKESVIDLSKMVTDERGKLYTIKNIVKPEDWHIDANKYYQEGLLQKSFARSSVVL
jgi:HD-GYP domain-containing protein (c-di-GMP phosphodiesterase class II)